MKEYDTITVYDTMTVAELKTLAKEIGVKLTTGMKKQDIINALKETEQKKPAENTEAAQEEKKNTSASGNQNVQKKPEQQKTTAEHNTENRGRNQRQNYNGNDTKDNSLEMQQLDSGETKKGILEVLPDGYGFIRCDNFLPGENDVYVSPAQIRRFNLKTGDIVEGNTRIRNQNEKFSALLYVNSVNGFKPSEAQKRKKFEDLTPIFPNKRIHLETDNASVGMRMVDLISPIGRGQRGMIVSPPKAGKTTLLKQIAKAITKNHPDMYLIILLIDERP